MLPEMIVLGSAIILVEDNNKRDCSLDTLVSSVASALTTNHQAIVQNPLFGQVLSNATGMEKIDTLLKESKTKPLREQDQIALEILKESIMDDLAFVTSNLMPKKLQQ